jgi:hypothetical protein
MAVELVLKLAALMVVMKAVRLDSLKDVSLVAKKEMQMVTG